MMTVLEVLLLTQTICDVKYASVGLLYVPRGGRRGRLCEMDEPCIPAQWGKEEVAYAFVTLPLFPDFTPSWSTPLSTWAMIKKPGLAPQ